MTGPGDPRVFILVLAAGKASRMGSCGSHKLLAEFDGMPLVRRSVQVALKAESSGVVVVTGHRASEIDACLTGLAVRIVFNGAYKTGMASSLIAGMEAVAPEADGVMVMLADMPLLTSQALRVLIDAFHAARGGAIIRAASNGKPGNPVILPRAIFSDLRRLRGDVGARSVVEASGQPIIDVDIGDAAHLDVDTPEAIRAAGGTVRE